MFCSKCGSQNNENSKFCKKCGAQLKPNLSFEQPMQMNQVPKTNALFKTVSVGVMIIYGLSFIIGLIGFSGEIIFYFSGDIDFSAGQFIWTVISTLLTLIIVTVVIAFIFHFFRNSVTRATIRFAVIWLIVEVFMLLLSFVTMIIFEVDISETSIWSYIYPIILPAIYLYSSYKSIYKL